MKKLLLIICIILGTLFVGCGKKEETKKEVAKVYHVGTNAEYAPFEYLDNGKIVGFDVELMNEIAKKVGIEIKWEDMTFDGLIPALQSGKIDIVIAAMTITPERLKAVNFSKPYLDSPTTFLTNEKDGISGMDGIKGKKYGVQLGSTQETLANTIEGATVVPYNTPAIAVLDLKAGKLDGVLVDKSVAQNFVDANSEIKIIGDLQGDSKAIAFNKNFDAALLEKVNAAIDELKKDGTIDKLIAKYKI